MAQLKATGVTGSLEVINAYITGSITGSDAKFTSITGSLQGNAATATTATNATNATNVAVTNDTTTNATHYVAFVGGTSNNQAINVDSSAFTYNPSTNTLTVANLAGLATNATNVAVTNDTVTNLTHYVAFVGGTTGNQAINVDSNTLTYNPSTNTLTVANLAGNASSVSNGVYTNTQQAITGQKTFNNISNQFTGSFKGDLDGNAATATTATNATNVAVTNDTTTNATHYVTFVGGTSNNQAINVDSSTLTYNPSTNTLTVANLAGLATNATQADNATNVAVTNDGTTNTNFYIPFVAASTGNTPIKVDNAGGVTYNPSTGYMIVGGRLGIGVTPTGAPLDVNGNGLIRGDLYTGTSAAEGDSTWLVRKRFDVDTGLYSAGANTVALTTSGFRQLEVVGATVGINKLGNSPTATLDVNGDTNITGSLVATSTISASSNISTGGAFIGKTQIADAGAIASATYFLAMTNQFEAPSYVYALEDGLSFNTTTNILNGVITSVSASLNSLNATNYPVFVNGTTGGRNIFTDSDYTYNPSTNTLTVGTISATNYVGPVVTTNGNNTFTGINSFSSTSNQFTGSFLYNVNLANGTAYRAHIGTNTGADITVMRISPSVLDSANFGFSIKYMGSRSGNSNSFSIFTDNVSTDPQVEAFTLLQDAKLGLGLNGSLPTEALEVNGVVKADNVEFGTLFVDRGLNTTATVNASLYNMCLYSGNFSSPSSGGTVNIQNLQDGRSVTVILQHTGTLAGGDVSFNVSATTTSLVDVPFILSTGYKVTTKTFTMTAASGGNPFCHCITVYNIGGSFFGIFHPQ